MDINEQDRDTFIKNHAISIEESGSDLDYVLNIKKDVRGFLIKELFNEKRKAPQDFDRAKLGVLRWIIERDLLKQLVQDYENCLQELIEVDQELDELLNKPISN